MVDGAFEFLREAEGILEVVGDELGEDVEALVEFEEEDLGDLVFG